MKKLLKLLVIGVLFTILVFLVISRFPKRIAKLGEENVLDGMSACALGTTHNYKISNNYPPLVGSRIDDSKFAEEGLKTFLTFPELPSEEEFLKQAKISEEEAIAAIDGKIIYYTDLVIPKATEYNYLVKNDNIESIDLTTLRHNFCHSQYRGKVESAIRIGWHIVMEKSKTKVIGVTYTNPAYDYKWHIFVDAVTGEIVYITQVRASEEFKKKAIPPWYMDETLQKVGAEYLYKPEF